MEHFDKVPTIFDSECSIVVTPCKQEFLEITTKVNNTMMGLGSPVLVYREITTHCTLKDDSRIAHTITTKVYYIPTSKVMISSLQSDFIQ